MVPERSKGAIKGLRVIDCYHFEVVTYIYVYLNYRLLLYLCRCYKKEIARNVAIIHIFNLMI